MNEFVCMLFASVMILPMETFALMEESVPEIDISNIYLVENGTAREISYDEYVTLMERSASIRPIIPENPGILPTMHTFDVYANDDSAERSYFGDAIGVSSIIEGELSVSFAEMYSETISASFSISVTSAIKKKLLIQRPFRRHFHSLHPKVPRKQYLELSLPGSLEEFVSDQDTFVWKELLNIG